MAKYEVTIRYLHNGGIETERKLEVEAGSFSQAVTVGVNKAALWLDPSFLDIRKVEVENKACPKT